MVEGETILVVNPNENDKYIVEVVKDIITSLGKVVSSENWGLRKLAYPMDGHNSGKYTLIEFKSNNFNKLVDKLEKYYKEEPKIIKHIIVKK